MGTTKTVREKKGLLKVGGGGRAGEASVVVATERHRNASRGWRGSKGRAREGKDGRSGSAAGQMVHCQKEVGWIAWCVNNYNSGVL